MSQAETHIASFEASSTAPPGATTSNRPCRNIALHGYCKYEGRGCKFNHGVTAVPLAAPAATTAYGLRPVESELKGYVGTLTNDEQDAAQHVSRLQLEGPSPDGLSYYLARTKMPELQHHLYIMPPPHHRKEANERNIHDFFVNESLRKELLKKLETKNLQPGPDETCLAHLPQEVHVYHSLYPLEEIGTSPESNVSVVYRAKTSIYRAMNSEDGTCYVLRRVERCRLHEEEALNAVDSWQRLRHSSCVSLLEAFTTKQFGDHSIIFVYDYFPCAKTLAEKYFKPVQAELVQERVLWGYLCQLASAIATVHSLGLACRCIDATKVIITGKNRIRVAGLGVSDIITYASNSPTNISHYQQEDLLALGHLMLSLTVGYPLHITTSTSDSLSGALDIVSRRCSLEFKNAVVYLLSKPSPMKHIHDIITMSANAMSRELNTSLLQNDYLEGEFVKELENGRLVRLLCQLGFVNERPEFDMDPQWSETGDRYVLKLFRDYVFHQVDAQGAPVLDMAFVLQCLNKLDAGYAEKIVLTTRDELSCLMASYAELKQCLLHSINDLHRKK